MIPFERTMKMVVWAIVVISFVGDICCIFRESGPGEVSDSLNGLSRSLKVIAK